jgi:hypothetical protein
MDGFNEKKWFVYLGDHHEGPFSLAEMQGKMNAGAVTSTHYVWCEGMGDWLPMTNVPQFESLIHARAAAVAVASSSSDAPTLHMPAMQAAPVQVKAAETKPAPAATAAKSPAPAIIVQSADEVSRPIILSAVSQSNPHVSGVSPIGLGSIPHRPEQFQTKKKGGGLLVKAIVILIIGSIGGVIHSGTFSNGFSLDPMMLSLTENVPFLANWISPIPAISEVSPEDYQELRNAAAQSLESKGPAAAFALSPQTLEAPTFYIATNFPDGTRFELTFDGIPGTLLGQLAVSLKIQAVTEKRIAKTDPVRFPDGRPIPRGQYKVTLTEAASQVEAAQAIVAGMPAKPGSTTKLRQTKSLFLGGARDAQYTSRLKEYVDELRKRAQTELAEIEQFSSTLEMQLNSTVNSFANIKKRLVSPRSANVARKEWTGVNTRWKEFQAKLNESFAKWNPASLSTDFFYGAMYAEMPKIAQAVEKVHATHDGFVTGQVKEANFDATDAQNVTSAQTMIAGLKGRIAKIKSAPPAANGVPQREAE